MHDRSDGAIFSPSWRSGWRKTAADLEAIIRVEMEEVCEWPTDTAVSVRPDGDTWKVVITHESGVDESDRFEMILLICDRLRSEFDLKG